MRVDQLVQAVKQATTQDLTSYSHSARKYLSLKPVDYDDDDFLQLCTETV